MSELWEFESSEKRNLSELFWNWISEKLKPKREELEWVQNKSKPTILIKLASVWVFIGACYFRIFFVVHWALTWISLLELLRLLVYAAMNWNPLVNSHRCVADCDPFFFPGIVQIELVTCKWNEMMNSMICAMLIDALSSYLCTNISNLRTIFSPQTNLKCDASSRPSLVALFRLARFLTFCNFFWHFMEPKRAK